MLIHASYQLHFHLYLWKEVDAAFIVGQEWSCSVGLGIVYSWHSETVSQLQKREDTPCCRAIRSISISSLLLQPPLPQGRHRCLELPGTHHLCCGTYAHTTEKDCEKSLVRRFQCSPRLRTMRQPMKDDVRNVGVVWEKQAVGSSGNSG